MFEWEIRVQAMQNQVFIAMCNRVGREGDMDFAGESLVVYPSGDVIIKADDRGAADTLRTESRRSTGMAGESSISGNQKARVVSVILRISLLHVTIKPLIAWRMKQQI